MKKTLLLCLLGLFAMNLQSLAQTCAVALTSPLVAPADLVLCDDGSDAAPYVFPGPSFGSGLADGALLVEIVSGGVTTVIPIEGTTTLLADASNFAGLGIALAPGDIVSVVGFVVDLPGVNTLLDIASNPIICGTVLGLPAATCTQLSALAQVNGGPGITSITGAFGLASGLTGATITSISSAYSTMIQIDAAAAAFGGVCFDTTGAVATFMIPDPDPTEPAGTMITVASVTPDFSYTVEGCTIPTMGEWALMCMGLMFLVIGTVAVREEEFAIELN